MAILGNSDKIAEIKFIDYKYGYVSYSLSLSYDDKPVINPELLWQYPFHFDEYGNDNLIPFFELVLRDSQNNVFYPLEPEIEIGLQFSSSLNGKSSDDVFTFFFRINDQKFKSWHDKTGAYGGFPFSFEVPVKRQELEKFVLELKEEYKDWKIRNTDLIEEFDGKYGRKLA